MTPTQIGNMRSKLRRIIGELDLSINAIDDALKEVKPAEPETLGQRNAAKLRRRLNEARMLIRDGLPPQKPE